MIYFIYSGTHHEKNSEKGIYHYTIYKEIYNYTVHTEGNVVPFSTAAEFIMSPILAALNFILNRRKFQKYDQIRIMCKDGLISQIINLRNCHELCPTFQEFWNGSFKNYQRCVVAFKIHPSINYDFFKINPNILYEREQRRVEKLKNMLFAS